MRIVRSGLPFSYAATAAGITLETLSAWRSEDEKFGLAFNQAKVASVKARWDIIQRAARGTKDTPGDWKAAAWSLERVFPHDFGRPEIQFTLNNNTVTNNTLSITITAEEVRQIEAIAEPVREAVKAMFAQYKPTLGNGKNGEPKPIVVEAEVVQKPIERKAGDEQSQTFWRTLVSSDPATSVARETAIFAIRALLLQTQGYKAHRTEINFDHDPITVEELFGTLERLCGGATGWQLAQKLGGF